MKTKTFFKIAAVGAFLLGSAFPALAQHAQVPVLSTNFVKPNVIILLDNSLSMAWNLAGNYDTSDDNPSRMTIAQNVLNGGVSSPILEQTQNVFMGQTSGTNNYNVRDSGANRKYVFANTPFANITTPFTKIMLLKLCTSGCTYQPALTTDPLATYFVLVDNDDVMFALAGYPNAPGSSTTTSGYMTTTTPNAFTTLDQFLWSQRSSSGVVPNLEIVNHTDIRDGGTTTTGQLYKPRDVYQASTTGTILPRDVFIQHFADVYNIPTNPCTFTYTTTAPPTVSCTTDSSFEAKPTGTGTPLSLASGNTAADRVTRTSRVFPVALVPNNVSTNYCYKSGTPVKYYGCYKPIAAGSQAAGSPFFVFMDQTDYDVAMNDTDDNVWAVSLPLREYLNSKGGLSYAWKAYGGATGTATSVCGDSTGACPTSTSALSDGRAGNRVLFQWVADGTAGATVFVDASDRPTDAEVRTAMTRGIPQVQLIDVIDKDGIYGPDFIFKSPFNKSLEYAVRMGLGIPQPTTNDILDTLNRGLTYVKNSVTYHFLDGKDADYNGVFDGLTYEIQYTQKDPGLLDIYTNIRWGLAQYDNVGTRGPDCPGGNSDFPGCGADLLINLPDEYTATTSAETVRKAVKNAIKNTIKAGEPGDYTPIADSLRGMYQYFFAPKTKPLPVGRNDTTPTMYTDQDCNPATGAPPTNCANEGHVVQDEKAYLNGCRKNFLVFVTDGVQTMGLGCPSGGSGAEGCPNANVIPAQRQWVNALKSGLLTGGTTQGDPAKGVKVFVIGFALSKTTTEGINGRQEVEAIALASKMDKDPTDTYTAPYYANSEAELKAAFSQIFNAIMSGSYTRSAPTTDAQETIEVDGYFTVMPSEPMWQGHLELYDLTTVSTPAELAGLTAMSDGALVLNATSPGNRDIFTAQPATVSGATAWRAWYKNNPVKWNPVDFIWGSAPTLLADLNPGNQDGDTTGAGGASRPADSTDAKVVISFIRNDTFPPSPSDGKHAHYKPDPSVVGGDTAIGPPRTWTLGAINRSVPLLVGPPGGEANTSFRQYDRFKDMHKDRPSLIYVGANDGMLHAFFKDDLNGTSRKPVQMEEAFAYIPHAVLGTLKSLRTNQWYYVDATPVAADVFLLQPPWLSVDWGTTAAQAAGCDLVATQRFCWRTLVVTGLGPGGREYFALDVSDQDTVSAANTSDPAPKIHPYWEFSDKTWNTPPTPDTERLGDTWSLPFLAELRQGDGTTTSVAAIFGGGWGSDIEQNVGNYIYFVNLDDASILRRYYIPDKDDPKWKTKMDKGLSLDTLTGSTVAAPFQAHNSLPGDASVVDVPDQEGLSELLYIGDLQGRVWKVNMASGDHSKWKACLFYDTGDRLPPDDNVVGDSKDKSKINDGLPYFGWTGTPTYADFDAMRRPVFYGPTVVEAPAGGRIVIFGTGHIEESSVARDEGVVNCIFAVWDQDPVDSDTVEDLCNYGTLWEQSLKAADCPQCEADISYPFCFEAGEKLISKPTVSEGLLSFQTFKPYSSNHCVASYNPCEPGVVRDWFVDYLTFYGILGLSPSLPAAQGRYFQQSEFSASGLTLTNKFGYVYTVPGGGLQGFTPPTGKSSDVLSWGEGISF